MDIKKYNTDWPLPNETSNEFKLLQIIGKTNNLKLCKKKDFDKALRILHSMEN